jgi:copper chaperone CopZ
MDHALWVCITLKLNLSNMKNNYSIDIKGIHCSGCVNLIKMTLEEQGFTNVIVEQERNIAQFESMVDTNEEEIKRLLDTVFTELQSYSYSNLHIIN